jgi:hypothetical protein
MSSTPTDEIGKLRPRVMAPQLWHDKDPYLLKSPERRADAETLQPFAGCSEIIETLILFCFLIDVFG